MTKQLEFDLFDMEHAEESHVEKVEKAKPLHIPKRTIQRAVLAWLLENDITGAALSVPTKISRAKADIGGFYSKAKRSKGKLNKIFQPQQTVLVECRESRLKCWPDCSNSAQLSGLLKKSYAELEALKDQIRKEEPELRALDTLFEEYAHWNYKDSQNDQYHQTHKTLKKLEQSLYKGTRFEGVLNSGVANLCYLAVPKGCVDVHELAEGWGLLWIDENFKVEEIRKPDLFESSPEYQLHFIQNIASVAASSVAFANGLYIQKTKVKLGRIPRKRRNP